MYNFDPKNFEEKWFDNWTVVFYFEKNKDEEFSECFNHASRKKSKRFTWYTDIKKFLAISENQEVKIYLTIWNRDIAPFIKIDWGFLIDIKSYIDFQENITGNSTWWKMRAFLTQTFNIHNQDQINRLIAQNTKEENIIEIVWNLELEKQTILLQSLQNKFWKWWNFDLKSDVEWVFLQIGNIYNRKIVIKQLQKLEQNNFANIENALSISKIEQVLEIWEANKNNSSEEFWQTTFETHNWILSQVFSIPMIFMKWKPYCWWKSLENSWWVMSDLWYKNLLTDVSIFIEIKTPKSEIIWKKYRGKEEWENNVIFGMSNELTWGIVQVSNQRETAISEFWKSWDIKIHNASSLLVIWSIPEDEDKKRSFSLFRNSNKDVGIITFDELFEKIKILRKIYE